RRVTIKKHCLAADVAVLEIRRRAEAQPNCRHLDYIPPCADRIRNRKRRLERRNGITDGKACLPGIWVPPRRHLEFLPPHMLELQRFELLHSPILYRPVIRRAGDSAPELVPVVAALARDRRDFRNSTLHRHAVDAGISLLARGQRPTKVGVVWQEELAGVVR